MLTAIYHMLSKQQPYRDLGATYFDQRNKTNIVILDACRNNPFETVKNFDDNGLAEMKAPTGTFPVSYTHLRAHETVLDLVCRLLLEKKN